jgi:hypothetical protein
MLIALATPGIPGEAHARKPRLDVRVTPHMALPPVEVLVVAELVGGDDLEEFYCPGLEWDWGDGTKSFHESDCAPYEAGARVDRLYSARHAYFQPGRYSVRVRLRRADRDVAAARASLLLGGAAMASRWE